MKHLLLLAGNCPASVGPIEMGKPPKIGDLLAADVGGVKRQIAVTGVVHPHVIPSGAFRQDEAWVICRVV